MDIITHGDDNSYMTVRISPTGKSMTLQIESTD
jgi:hypothetical protein